MGIQCKKQHIMIMGIVACLFWCTIVAPIPVAATPATGAGFSVHAIRPENQINDQVSYFDLHMQPNQTQTLSVEITNTFTTPITIIVEAISASTSQNGIIDYKTPGIQDETLRIPFSDISIVEEPSILVPANSTKTANITITMPDDMFDGVILGGLVFTREMEEDTNAQTTSIKNQFNYVIGAKLSETQNIVLPQFEIVEIIPETVNYQPAFTHKIRNTQAAIVKNMSIDVSIVNEKHIVQATASMRGVDMAPNSIMPFIVTPNDTILKPGDYLSNIHLEHEGKTFDYQIPFTITADEADYVNDESILEESSNVNLYLILLCIILTFIIIILVVILIRKRKQK
jgi:Bacterial protein of unknown function (DUF916)./Protein of unknown function C-terminal (DUF3324).